MPKYSSDTLSVALGTKPVALSCGDFTITVTLPEFPAFSAAALDKKVALRTALHAIAPHKPHLTPTALVRAFSPLLPIPLGSTDTECQIICKAIRNALTRPGHPGVSHTAIDFLNPTGHPVSASFSTADREKASQHQGKCRSREESHDPDPSTIPHSTLGKRWNALSYHRVREAIAGGWLRFEHIPGTENPADVLTKSLAWNVLKTYIEPLLFWKGETFDAPSGSPNPEGSTTSPGHETPLTSSVSTNVSVDVDMHQHDSEADVDARQHNPGQDQDQPAFNRLWNNQYAVLMELDI
eukprot:scaffold79_cov145-Amphora_coffeaeformis.AAC.8